MLSHVTSSENWQNKNLGAKGFTLIELLVVIIILGILAAVVVLGVGAIQDRGQVEACKTELRSVRAATAAYRADTGGYPASTGVLETANYIDGTPDGTYTIATTGEVAQTACP